MKKIIFALVFVAVLASCGKEHVEPVYKKEGSQCRPITSYPDSTFSR